jgi:isoquinoline 1-oxidoreductase beta subunit
MLLRAAAAKLAVEQESLTTDDGRIVHRASGRAFGYGELAAAALALASREDVPLKDPKDFRWIGRPVARLDMRDMSTGRAVYATNLKVQGILHAAVVHAPHFGTEPEAIANEAEVGAMPGVHAVHRLPGAVAVTADSWWRARKAAEALKVAWTAPAPDGVATVSASFSSTAMREALSLEGGEIDRLCEAFLDAAHIPARRRFTGQVGLEKSGPLPTMQRQKWENMSRVEACDFPDLDLCLHAGFPLTHTQTSCPAYRA